MHSAPEWEEPLLAGCLTAVPIRWNPHFGAPPSLPPAPSPAPPPDPPTGPSPGFPVEVWRADLDALPEGPAELLEELLCTEERSRARRMVKAQDRERWMRARGLLRALLASHLECDPRTLRFQPGKHGKPALAGGSARGFSELHFNLSHSAGLAVYALARGASVGGDIEALQRRPSRDDVALAEHVFGAELAGRLRALAPAERRREFLREWVRHEATRKCLGVGRSGPQPPQAATAGLRLAELDVGPEAMAAIAMGTQAL